MSLTRREVLQSTAGAIFGMAGPAISSFQDRRTVSGGVSIQLIRHATCVIHYGGKTFLLDPMLSDAEAMPPIARTPNPRSNPLVALPVTAPALVTSTDAALVTHTHFDHWDAPARDLLPKNRTLFVQPPDESKIEDAGFSAVRSVASEVAWERITITRVGGQHGRGDTGQRMGPVSGSVLTNPGSPTLYIAGDSVWCAEVDNAIRVHKPDVIIVNAGAAQFLEGGPITMDIEDVASVCRSAPRAKVVAVHMEAINHCVLTRDGLRAGLKSARVNSTVLIPGDGEVLQLA
jgi:L-ascorbate metabolism protein UlaG (beta-lactamase superfamily)